MFHKKKSYDTIETLKRSRSGCCLSESSNLKFKFSKNIACQEILRKISEIIQTISDIFSLGCYDCYYCMIHMIPRIPRA
jgi:hypothetical protein